MFFTYVSHIYCDFLALAFTNDGFFNSTLFALIIFVVYLISSYFRWKAMREAVESDER